MRLYFLHLKIISKSKPKNWPLTMDGLGSTGSHCLCLFSDTKGAFRVLVSKGSLPQSQSHCKGHFQDKCVLVLLEAESMNLVWRTSRAGTFLDLGLCLGAKGATQGVSKQGSGVLRFGFSIEWATLGTERWVGRCLHYICLVKGVGPRLCWWR